MTQISRISTQSLRILSNNGDLSVVGNYIYVWILEPASDSYGFVFSTVRSWHYNWHPLCGPLLQNPHKNQETHSWGPHSKMGTISSTNNPSELPPQQCPLRPSTPHHPNFAVGCPLAHYLKTESCNEMHCQQNLNQIQMTYWTRCNVTKFIDKFDMRSNRALL